MNEAQNVQKRRGTVRGVCGYTLRVRGGRWYVRIRRPGADGWAEESAEGYLPGAERPCSDCVAGDVTERAGCGCQRALRRAVETALEELARVWRAAARSERLAEFRAVHLPTRCTDEQVSEWATVGEVLDALAEGERLASESEAAALNVRTCRAYGVGLVRVARYVAGVADGDAERVRLDPDALESVRAVCLGRLCTAETVRGMQARAQGVPVPNYRLEHPAHGGVNAAVRNALGALAAMRVLAPRLRVPDLAGMRSVERLREVDHGFVPWSADALRGMAEGAEKLREEKPALYAVHLWLRLCGLRDAELLGARRDWLEEVRPGEWQLVLCWRPDWQLLKRGRLRRIGVGSELAGMVAGLRPRQYLVGDGLGETARYDLIYREHSRWLRQWIPERTKSNHELRKLAGSEVYMRDGLQAAAYFLGDSAQTTERHYASYLGAVAPLGLSPLG